MNTYQELFTKVINTFESEELKEFALFCLPRIPSYFWEVPASSSGKYHPITDLGEGGLARHSLMVYRIALDLKETWNEDINAFWLDKIYFACLFHDCCKNGMENNGYTQHDHPLIAGRFLMDCLNSYNKTTPDLSDEIGIIGDLIACHMGKWTISKYSNVILPAPIFEEESCVHQCDYIASRKYVLFDEDFFNNL